MTTSPMTVSVERFAYTPYTTYMIDLSCRAVKLAMSVLSHHVAHHDTRQVDHYWH